MSETETETEPKTISLTADELKTLWADGILSDTAYVVFAIKLNEHRYQRMDNFDITSFLLEWQAEYEDSSDKPKVKTLKAKAVRDAIDKMIAASLAKVQEQLQLRLNW